MFRHSLAKAKRVLLLSAAYCILPAISHAQLLTGYGDINIDAPPSQPQIISDNEIYDSPSLDAHKNIKTNTYTNFLTSPLSAEAPPEKQPLDIEADIMNYNDIQRIVSAQGDVIIVQDDRILRADKVEYAIDQDTVRASGNVVLNEQSGDIYLSQNVEYSNELQNGTVDDLQTTLADGSRFAADKGRREEGARTIMEGASYTACDPCKKDPGRAPPWKIVASKVTHDEEDARISYRNARFNVYGVPIAYTPYFSHADGTVKQKSGFLSPSLGFNSDLGAFIRNEYYVAIAPDKDATFGLQAMTEQAPLGLIEYRQRWDSAGLIVDGSVTYSDRTEELADGTNIARDDELRGHAFAKGRWDMNDQWRSGFDVAYVSDDQYVRQYDITDEDVLVNTIFAERFSGRNYATALVQLFKDIRVSERQVDQPGVLPELFASFTGKPGAVPFIKGRWDASLGLLSLFREGSDQDMIRASADVGWKRRLVSDYGLVSNLDLSLRGDAFHVNDPDISTTTSGNESDSLETRFFPQVHIETSYPVARNFEKAQMVIEPLVAITASTENDENDEIPNEDSQDVQLDASNLFEPNRFPGLDVVEDQSRVTYGMRTALNGYEQSNAEFFLGQSYRFDKDNNPFRTGSGLSNRSSDIVGYIKGDLNNRYRMQYRFQLNNENLSPERHELDSYADWNRFRLGLNYLYAQPISGTELNETREQIGTNAQYYFNPKWRMRIASQHDLGVDPGLRRGSLGIDYFGQCVSWSLQGIRNLTDDSSGDSGTEVLFRIGLRNISDFVETGLRDEGRSP